MSILRPRLTQVEKDLIIALHNGGEKMDTIVSTVERPAGTVNGFVRQQIQNGVLKARITSAPRKAKVVAP